MEMTERQICLSYKTAKNKKAQIRILAELNATTDLQIEKVLLDNGLFDKPKKDKRTGFVQTAEMQRITRFKRMKIHELMELKQKHLESIKNIDSVLDWKFENGIE